MLLDAETLRKSAQMHPDVLKFLDSNKAPDVDWENAEATYNFFDAVGKIMAEQLGAPEPTIIEEYRDILMHDGFASSVKIHRPKSPPITGSPLIVFFFGGGWISGDREAGTVVARAWTRLFGATVVNASYRLAPQHKFPTGQDDCWDTVKWLDEHAQSIGADLAQGFLVSGVSAGGSNAACITASSLDAEHAADGKGELTHPITGQHLCVPSLMDEDSVPAKYKSYFVAQVQNKDAPILPTSALRALQRHTSWDSRSPWRYVVNSKAPISKFPPTYIQVCGMDPLRDDGLIYEEMLKEAGVKTKIDLYAGCPHAHFSFYPNIEPTHRALADIVVGIGWLLGKDVTPEQALGALVKPS